MLGWSPHDALHTDIPMIELALEHFGRREAERMKAIAVHLYGAQGRKVSFKDEDEDEPMSKEDATRLLKDAFLSVGKK